MASPTQLTPVRLLILAGITLQITAFTLAQRYSLGILKEQYHKPTVLLMAETIKFVVSSAATWMRLGYSDYQPAPSDAQDLLPVVDMVQPFAQNTFMKLVTSSLPMSLPAIIYVIQNLFTFMALERIDAGTYTLLAQGKLVAVAVFSRTLMGKRLTLMQWRAIFSLSLAVVLLTYSQVEARKETAEKSSASAPSDVAHDAPSDADMAYQSYVLGCAITLCNVALSGFSTNFMECMFKGANKGVTLTVWERNTQLAFFSIIVNLVLVQTTIDGGASHMFDGFTTMAAVCACLLAVGGILIALSLKYTDSLLKSIASTLAIVLTPSVEVVVMGTTVSPYFIIGTVFVILSIQDYQTASRS